MENRNKTIIVLVILIIVLSIILGIKILNKSTNANEILKSSNLQSENLEKNNSITNSDTDNIITNNIEINQNNNIIYDSGEVISKSLTSKKLIISIINIIIILAIVPIILRRYNLITCVIIMVIYELLASLILGTLIPGLFIKIIYSFAYYYLFLWIVNKFLLEAEAIPYFFGVIITNIAINWIFEFILALILSI